MLASPRVRTPLPPRPTRGSAALDVTHTLLAALVECDDARAQALFDPAACVWWSERGGLASVEGSASLARALSRLLESAPPTRLTVVGSSATTTVTSAYLDDTIAWSLEIRVAAGQIEGAFLRGAHLASR